MLPIVIVDDSPDDAILAQRVLGQCKIQNPVILLKSGQAGLDYFRAAPPFENRTLPCLLLLDMIMAPVSGLNVLLRLRDISAARRSVIVMLSGLADLRTIHEGYQLGANTFLVKPLSAGDVMQMLRAIRGLSVNPVANGYELMVPSVSTESDTEFTRTPTFPNLQL